jgi:hypothetical protein
MVFGNCWEREPVTKDEYLVKVNEVDRLLNDPTISLDPMRIWFLLSELGADMPFESGVHEVFASHATDVGLGKGS